MSIGGFRLSGATGGGKLSVAMRVVVGWVTKCRNKILTRGVQDFDAGSAIIRPGNRDVGVGRPGIVP